MFLQSIILFVLLSFCNTLHIDDNCDKNGNPGRCTLLEKCPSAIKELHEGYPPTNCGFQGTIPIVCCENVIHRNYHVEKCKEYGDEIISTRKLVDNDNFFIQVVGGTNAKIDEYPHMAALGFGEKTNIQWNCGGSLISKKYILTAAHCLYHQALGNVKYARLGDIELKGSGTAEDFEIKRAIRHPEYVPPKVYNDIALLELDKEVRFSEHIKPACMYQHQNISDLNKITATGWGLTEFAGNPSNILQTVDLEIFTLEECNRTFKSSGRRLPQGVRDDVQICAGGRNAELDTCQGDSGGPLQWRANADDLHMIIGVTSLGKGCGVADVPAIYTRVAHYIPWIQNIVWS